MNTLSHFEKLNPSEQAFYQKLYDALLSREPAISAETFQPKHINRLFKYILLDHPELCEFEGQWAYDAPGNLILPVYALPPEAGNAAREAAARLLQHPAFSEHLPPQSTAKLLFDFLLRAVIYDVTAPNSQNLYGALVERRAVCKGIAKAYQYLLLQQNIPCVLAEGSLDGVGKHIWNLICINGQWLHADICMGYPPFQRLIGRKSLYSCFLVDTQTISRSHIIHTNPIGPTLSEKEALS